MKIWRTDLCCYLNQAGSKNIKFNAEFVDAIGWESGSSTERALIVDTKWKM
jgi:hypothetical protein